MDQTSRPDQPPTGPVWIPSIPAFFAFLESLVLGSAGNYDFFDSLLYSAAE
jgi:hypothetical protein